MKFLRRVKLSDYVADQEVEIEITSTPQTDTDIVQNVPLSDTALEVEIEGKRYVILASRTKN